MIVGVMMKKIFPLSSPAAFSNNMLPDPNIPAKPVPEPKKPTVELGKPLQKPRVVLSPKAEPVPRIIDDNKESQKEASCSLKVQAKEMIKNPMIMFIEFTKILTTCLILMRYLALTTFVKLLKRMSDLKG